MAITGTGKLYGSVLAKAFNKEISIASDVIKVILCTSDYVPSKNHAYKSDITNEVVGAGYTAGGATLTNKSVVYISDSDVTKIDADDNLWSNSTITARYAIIYGSTGTDNTSPLIGYVDFGVDVGVTNGTFSIAWDVNGIFTGTVS